MNQSTEKNVLFLKSFKQKTLKNWPKVLNGEGKKKESQTQTWRESGT